MNNSVVGHPWAIRSGHEFGHLYLFAIAGFFSFVTLLRQKKTGLRKLYYPADHPERNIFYYDDVSDDS